MANLSVIIPAATYGRRMKAYGAKCLIELNNETILGRQIRLIREVYGNNTEIILVGGYDIENIKQRYGRTVCVVENADYATTNITRSIKIGLDATRKDNILIVYGDLVFNENALALPTNETSSLICSHGILSNEVGVTVVDDYISQYSYGLMRKWGQVIYLTGKNLQLFRSIVQCEHRRNYYGFELLNILLNKGNKIKAVEPKGLKIVEVDHARDIKRAKLI